MLTKIYSPLELRGREFTIPTVIWEEKKTRENPSVDNYGKYMLKGFETSHNDELSYLYER